MAMSEWEWAPGTGQEHIDRITRFHMDSLAVPVEQRLRPLDPGGTTFRSAWTRVAASSRCRCPR